MVEIKLIGVDYQVPSSWRDITWLRYCEILQAYEKPFITRLSVYTGIAEDVLNKLTLSGIGYLCEVCHFMEAHDLLSDLATPYTCTVKIGHETYGKLEACKQEVMKFTMPILAGAEIVQRYLGDDIKGECVLECYHKANGLIEAINTFLEQYKRLNDYHPSEEEEEAGVENVSRFGVWGTAVAYARRTNMTPSQVFDRPAVEIYNTLLLDFENSEFSKKLSLIHQRNNKLKVQ